MFMLHRYMGMLRPTVPIMARRFAHHFHNSWLYKSHKPNRGFDKSPPSSVVSHIANTYAAPPAVSLQFRSSDATHFCPTFNERLKIDGDKRLGELAKECLAKCYPDDANGGLSPVVLFQNLAFATYAKNTVAGLALIELAVKQRMFNGVFALQAVRFLLDVSAQTQHKKQVKRVCKIVLDYVCSDKCNLPTNVLDSVHCAALACTGQIDEAVQLLNSETKSIRAVQFTAALVACQAFVHDVAHVAHLVLNQYFGKLDPNKSAQVLPLVDRLSAIKVIEQWALSIYEGFSIGSITADVALTEVEKLCEQLIARRWNSTDKLVDHLNNIAHKINKKEARNVLSVERFEIDRLVPPSICPKCRNEMQTHLLSEEETTALKDAVYNTILVPATNKYLSSVPGEIERYFRFLHGEGPFRVTVDGLNVFFMNHVALGRTVADREMYQMVLDKICFVFNCEPKDVLITGRKHVKQRVDQRTIYKALRDMGAKIFLLNDISTDDAFLLYAALCSGPGTWVLSRDRFADHSSSLTPYHAFLYHKYATSRHSYITHYNDKDEPFFRAPPGVLPLAQGGNATYHIPISDGHYQFFYTLPFNWVCIRKRLLNLNQIAFKEPDKQKRLVNRNKTKKIEKVVNL